MKIGAIKISLLASAVLATTLFLSAGTVFAEISEDNTRFAFDLYNKIGAEYKGDNILISPFSISAALAMTYAGARGDTEKQMALTLRSSLEQSDFHPAFSLLLGKMEKPDRKEYQLHIANALWGQKGCNFNKSFLALTEKYYKGGFKEADFANDTQGSRQTINLWVEQNTGGKIKDLLHARDIEATTRLVLTNAVYFKGEWERKFKVVMTHSAPFHVSPEKDVDVKMMSQQANFAYAEISDKLQIIEMPYKGSDLSIVVLLPMHGYGLPDLESDISSDLLKKWLSGMHSALVNVRLPKFKFETRYYLQGLLKSMGMTDAFVYGNADFSGIDGDKDLYISAVIHQALVSVDEEGTEAAAATAVGIETGCARGYVPPRPIIFTADHPFMFLIMHKPTGSVLFMGRVENPEK